MKFLDIAGVPDFECYELLPKKNDYCLLIPILNEKGRIEAELKRAMEYGINETCDIIIIDGGSNDGSCDELIDLGINTILLMIGEGAQGAQLRCGFFYADMRGYKGFVTVDGNNKDSIESVPLFIDKINEGYDFVQGSRYLIGGKHQNTPFMRYIASKLIHIPLISKAAQFKFTDTTNGFRAYSKTYINHKELKIFRDIFSGYELLAYLSVRASQLGLRVVEVPVERVYPKGIKTPTKINPVRGSCNLLKILFRTIRGEYNP